MQFAKLAQFFWSPKRRPYVVGSLLSLPVNLVDVAALEDRDPHRGCLAGGLRLGGWLPTLWEHADTEIRIYGTTGRYLCGPADPLSGDASFIRETPRRAGGCGTSSEAELMVSALGRIGVARAASSIEARIITKVIDIEIHCV